MILDNTQKLFMGRILNATRYEKTDHLLKVFKMR